MAEEKKNNNNGEPAKTVETSSIDSSKPPPGNEETMLGNLKESHLEAAEDLTHAKTNQSEAEPQYPTLKKLIPTVIALYLAFFLVALVCSILHSTKSRLIRD